MAQAGAVCSWVAWFSTQRPKSRWTPAWCQFDDMVPSCRCDCRTVFRFFLHLPAPLGMETEWVQDDLQSHPQTLSDRKCFLQNLNFENFSAALHSSETFTKKIVSENLKAETSGSSVVIALSRANPTPPHPTLIHPRLSCPLWPVSFPLGRGSLFNPSHTPHPNHMLFEN